MTPPPIKRGLDLSALLAVTAVALSSLAQDGALLPELLDDVRVETSFIRSSRWVHGG